MSCMPHLRLILLLLLGLQTAFATAQFPDRLHIEGDAQEHSLYCNPLEQLFAKQPERRPKSEGMCTALWRGYVGVFQIKAGIMTVKDVLVRNPKSRDFDFISKMGESFPIGTDRKMPWFTGLLVLPQGKELEYVHMGYASLYERYRLVYIKEGKVAADRVFTADEYREFRLLQWDIFKKTDEYKKMLAETLKNMGKDKSELEAEKFLATYSTNFQSDIIVDYKDFKPTQPPAK